MVRFSLAPPLTVAWTSVASVLLALNPGPQRSLLVDYCLFLPLGALLLYLGVAQVQYPERFRLKGKTIQTARINGVICIAIAALVAISFSVPVLYPSFGLYAPFIVHWP